MMKRLLASGLLLLLLSLTMAAATKYPYQDANQPVDKRVKDLLSRMTLEEKVGQLVCLMGWDSYVRNGNKVAVSDKFRNEIDSLHVGMYWAVFRADPWTQKTLDNGLNPALAAEAANAMQRYAIEHSRLGIPIFLAEEAPHGHMAIGTTVFPTGLGMAATWDPQLMEQAGAVISKEIRLQGGHISYGPVLDLAREPRWSRVEETLGEDSYLSGEMGAAMVRGLGGGDLSLPYSTIATLKHFIAYGVSEGGQNGARSIVGPRELKQVFLEPFRRVINAGALSVMTAY
ncbi:MAG: beta-glucosidase, partial [Muribaculaceae bacterium]|nr:beta-glucosidase [Muribaculaceae bacterium]